MKKYKLTDETTIALGVTLYRIAALIDFADVKKGDKGGFVKSEENLSQNGDCWVYGDAKVFDRAKVFEDAKVCGNTKVFGDAVVFGDADIYGDAEISGQSDYIVFKNWWSSGRYFTWTRSNNKWKVGDFYGTGEELIRKAYADSKMSGKEYERIVKYVESILNDDAISI